MIAATAATVATAATDDVVVAEVIIEGITNIG
jgi:hypothetical protein